MTGVDAASCLRDPSSASSAAVVSLTGRVFVGTASPTVLTEAASVAAAGSLLAE